MGINYCERGPKDAIIHHNSTREKEVHHSTQIPMKKDFLRWLIWKNFHANSMLSPFSFYYLKESQIENLKDDSYYRK